MIFISYSREDIDFAKKLALDLKNSKASVWIDHIDISVGDHWDTEIEKALTTASHLLVILSQNSSSSESVKDEINYAITEGKTIIPVLLEKCKIPFRLQRKHYIDFTANYESGFNNLKTYLKLELNTVKNGEYELKDEKKEINISNPYKKKVTYSFTGISFATENNRTDTSANLHKGLKWAILMVVMLGFIFMLSTPTAEDLFQKGMMADSLKNYSEALNYFQQGANLGSGNAMNKIGRYYYKGYGGLQKDEEKARKWYQKAADLGNADAINSMGVYYDMGYGGLLKDEREALRYFQKAADLDNTHAMMNIGMKYNFGFGGLERNEKEALKWFQKAAALGNAHAMYQIGLYYDNGYGGLQQDKKEALKWFQKAAALGNAHAMYQIGLYYDNGYGGLQQDKKEALKWLQKAADLGDEDAKSWLEGILVDTVIIKSKAFSFAQ